MVQVFVGVLLMRALPILIALSCLIWALVCCLWSGTVGLLLTGAASLAGALFCPRFRRGSMLRVCAGSLFCAVRVCALSLFCAVLVGLCVGCSSVVMMDWYGCLGVVPFLIAVAIIW